MFEEFMLTSRSPLKVRFFMLIVVIIILMVIGTFFYHFVEGWSIIDSLYFSSISLSTRGYGELHPTTVASKLFTVFYLFIGVAFILYALSSLIGYFMKYQEPAIKRRMDSIVNSISPPKKDKWIVIRSKPKKENL